MSKAFSSVILIAALMVFNLQAQNTGVGVKLGEPTGLNLKLYRHVPIEFTLGTGGIFWSWGVDKPLKRHLDRKYGAGNWELDFAYTSRPLFLHVVFYPFFRDLGIREVPNLNLEIGLGGQAGFATIHYGVHYDRFWTGDEWIYLRYDEGSIPDIDIGPAFAIGLDWLLTAYNVPLSVSLDFNIGFEIFDNPLANWYWGLALGLRYLF